MRNGSSPRFNRHGVPLRPAENKGCRWSKYCSAPVEDYPRSELCNRHAEYVAFEVNYESRQRSDAKLQAALEVQPPAESPPDAGVIYYVQVGPHIKVGWTSDLGKRMRQYPPNSQLLAVHPGTRAEERALHAKFAVWRSHGREWYPLVPVLLDHIKRMVAQHGEPEAQAFGAKPVEVPQSRERQAISLRPRTTRKR